MKPAEDRDPPPDEPPPFFGSWGRVYGLVILCLALLIGALYSLSRAFAP